MKIPEKLKIGGFIWTVEEDANVAEQGQCFGASHLRSQKIFTDPKNTKQKNEHTIFHEILHAVWWQAGLSSRNEIKDHEEQVVDALSNGLYQVLKDNKLL